VRRIGCGGWCAEQSLHAVPDCLCIGSELLQNTRPLSVLPVIL
jgi:hypothetical protein